MVERSGKQRSSSKAPSDGAAPARPPLHPYWVLLVAVVLPGVGQVLNNTPARGMMMVFFLLSFGWITWHLTTPEHSFAGRYAGALFIYAVSVMDAYRWARYRWAFFHRGAPDGTALPAGGR